MHLLAPNGQRISLKKPRITLTYALLLNYHSQLEHKRVNNHVDYFLLEYKIDEFYEKFSAKIDLVTIYELQQISI